MQYRGGLVSPEDEQAAHDAFVLALMQIREMMNPLTETVLQYRVDMESKGFTPEQASMMAVDYHGALLRAGFK